MDHDLAARFKIDMVLGSTPDHAAPLAELKAGKVVAFATDDVLLYRLIAEAQGDFVVIGDFLSYEPYGIAYRKGDAQLA
ncbi:MAG TPA: transporter substrate-binding domain-containing protein [Burkholderiaceae bacterium]|nr:transporter substrate-binding domain-containing protein [Burkholderiaceae bacterium]